MKLGSDAPTSPNYSFTNGSYVKTISAVCQTFPSDGECPCNVYIGGLFEILNFADSSSSSSAVNHRAVNIAKWNDEKNLWDPLGGVFAFTKTIIETEETFSNGTKTGNIITTTKYINEYDNTITMNDAYTYEVNTVHRRNKMDPFPYNTLVFIGGNFPGYLKYYTETLVDSFSDGTWFSPVDTINLMNGPIDTLFVQKADWPEDPTLLGITGSFNFKDTNHV